MQNTATFDVNLFTFFEDNFKILENIPPVVQREKEIHACLIKGFSKVGSSQTTEVTIHTYLFSTLPPTLLRS